MEDELKEYGLVIRESDSPDRQMIDFNVEDEEDNVAWIWGDSWSDIDWECNHPYQCIEFGDLSDQCECMLCGAYGDWHYEEDDEGHKTKEPHEWYPRRKAGGLIGEYLKELQKRW